MCVKLYIVVFGEYLSKTGKYWILCITHTCYSAQEKKTVASLFRIIEKLTKYFALPCAHIHKKQKIDFGEKKLQSKSIILCNMSKEMQHFTADTIVLWNCSHCNTQSVVLVHVIHTTPDCTLSQSGYGMDWDFQKYGDWRQTWESLFCADKIFVLFISNFINLKKKNAKHTFMVYYCWIPVWIPVSYTHLEMKFQKQY